MCACESIRAYVCLCTYVYVSVCARVCLSVYMSIYGYVSTHLCAGVCVCVRVHMGGGEEVQAGMMLYNLLLEHWCVPSKQTHPAAGHSTL